MRLRFSLPISLIAGVALGASAFWNGQERLPTADERQRRVDLSNTGEASDSIGRAANFESKIQRLIPVAKLKGNPTDRANELYLVIETFTAEDFRHLVADVGILKKLAEDLSVVSPVVREMVFAGLVNRCLEIDGGMALVSQLIESIPGKTDSRQAILMGLVKTQPEKMLTMLSLVKDKSRRAYLLREALAELECRDHVKAAAWLANCADPEDRRVAGQAFRIAAVRADPVRVGQIVEKIDGRAEQSELIRAAVEAAAEKGTPELIRLAKAPMKPWMRLHAIQKLSQRDPLAAFDLAVQLGKDEADIAGMVKVSITAIDRTDHNLALAKMEGLTGPALAAAVTGIAYSWINRDPAAALAWLAEYPPENRKDPRGNNSDALINSFLYWAESGQPGAQEWADALPEGDLRNKIQSEFARSLAKENPGEAARILASLGDAANPKSFAEVAKQWARNDPLAAADWAIAQLAGPAQSRALSSIVGEWANDDAAGVQNWLVQFPAGDARDSSIVAFLERREVRVPDAVNRTAEFEKWFDLIDDPFDRAEVAVSLYSQRKESDPEGARKWLQSLPNVDTEVIRMAIHNNRW